MDQDTVVGRWPKAANDLIPDTQKLGPSLIGTILMTALLVWNFVLTFLNVLRDLVPAVTLFSSFIYAFGCLTVIVFFFVFRQAQC
jgi:hypothetical protein